MAERKAILKVGIEGEREYKSAIAEINRGNQVLKAEMNKLAEEYKGNESSMEAMRAKSDVLERQLLQQKDKVQTLREALENAANSFGEADRRTQSWQTQLYNAERDQIKLERALEETNKAIVAQGAATEEDSKKMVGLGDSVDQVASKLGVHLPAGAKDALNGIEGLSVGTVAAMAAAAGAVAGVVKVTKELHEVTLQAAADADKLLTQSAITGISTETLQAWTYAQELIDVSVDTMTGSLTKLTNSIYDAANGNDKLAETFDTLGVSIYDTSTGQLRPAEEVFYDVIDALGQMQDQTTRDAVAMDLMGKSAQELNPLIKAGGSALADFTEEAKEAGYVLDESQIKKLAEVDDEYQKVKLEIKTLTKQMALEFAPIVRTTMETFRKLVSKAGKSLEESHLVENFGLAVQNVSALLEAGAELAASWPKWSSPLKAFAKDLEGLSIVAAAMADSVDLISGLMPGNWGSGKAKTALGLNLKNGQMSHMQQLKYGSDWTYSNGAWTQMSGAAGYDPSRGLWYAENGDYIYYNAAGDYNWRGGLTWVGEGGPELMRLPQGSQIHSNQESRQMVEASRTDTSRIEALLSRIDAKLDRMEYDLADAQDVRRMA